MSRRHKIPASVERGALYIIIALLGLAMILLIVHAHDYAELEGIRVYYENR